MRALSFTDDIKPVSEFRNKAAGFIEQVHETKRPLIITQNGKSAAVLLDVSVYDDMVEKLELMRDVETANQQYSEGKYFTLDESRKKNKARAKK